MDASVFRGFFQFARIAAAVYIVIQIIVMLDFVFKINASMVDRDECRAPLIALTAALFAGSVTGLALLYHNFAPSASCSRNIFLITFTLILSLAVVALSVSPVRTEQAGLMTGMFVVAYCMYLCASALYSSPGDACSNIPFDGQTTWLTVVTFVLTLLILVIAVVNTAADHATLAGTGETADLDEPAGEDVPYNAAYFHTVFALATCFMVMLFTNWSLLATPGQFELDRGTASLWIKIAAQWLCFALYTWMLVAHRVLKSRAF